MGLCLLSFLLIVRRKIAEHYKEKKIVQNIQVNLGQNQHLYNTSKYNKSIISLKILAVACTLIMSYGFFAFSYKFFKQNMDYDIVILKYKVYIFIVWMCSPLLFSILAPVLFLLSNTDFRSFMFKAIMDFLHIQ